MHRKTQYPEPRAHRLAARASNSLSLPNRVLPTLKLPALTSVPSKLTSTLSSENNDPTCVPYTGNCCPPSDSSFPAPPPYIQTHTKDAWAQRWGPSKEPHFWTKEAKSHWSQRWRRNPRATGTLHFGDRPPQDPLSSLLCLSSLATLLPSSLKPKVACKCPAWR